MIPAAFEYARAGSVAEAVQLLGRYGEDAKVLAGGHSLLPLMKLRLANPPILVDINRIAGLVLLGFGFVLIGEMVVKRLRFW